MQVIPKPDRAPPWLRRAPPPRAPQPRQQLLHPGWRSGAAVPGVAPAAAAGEADEQRCHPLLFAHTPVVSGHNSQVTSCVSSQPLYKLALSARSYLYAAAVAYEDLVQNKPSRGELYKLGCDAMVRWETYVASRSDPPARTHVHGDEASTMQITKIQLQASFSEPRAARGSCGRKRNI